MPDRTMREILNQTAHKMTGSQILLSLILMVILSGGGGHFILDTVTGDRAGMQQTISELNQSVRELNQTLRDQNTAIESLRNLMGRTRCEVAAMRNNEDWRNCWLPDSDETGDIP